MPIYEYRCHGCKKVFSFLVGVVADSGEPECPRCGSREFSKLISKVARIRSKDAILEDLADPSQIDNPDNPRAVAQWAKKIGKTLGDETGEDFGAEMDEMLENPTGGEEGTDEE
jgi:putative FmdB family regulatory protein